MKRLPILLSLLALIVLAASLAYWVLQLYQPPQRPLAAAPQAVLPEPAIDAAATLFGGQAAAAVATNYTLTGVVAAGRESVAIIVAEGSPPKALRIGKELVPGVTVSEVHPRYVMLSDGGVMKRIDLPAETRTAAAAPGGAAPGGSAPPGGEPPVSPGPVQTQEAPPETPPVAVPPAPAPAPAPPQAQQQQQQQQPAPQPTTQAAPSGAAAAPPPPAPVQMPPPTRASGSPVNTPRQAQ
ncbi:MAG: type II secretion system protein N [Massilia sp.]